MPRNSSFGSFVRENPIAVSSVAVFFLVVIAIVAYMIFKKPEQTTEAETGTTTEAETGTTTGAPTGTTKKLVLNMPNKYIITSEVYRSEYGELFNTKTGLTKVTLPASLEDLTKMAAAVPDYVASEPKFKDIVYNFISVFGDGGFRLYNITGPPPTDGYINPPLGVASFEYS
jgi:hypothetical protein